MEDLTVRMKDKNGGKNERQTVRKKEDKRRWRLEEEEVFSILFVFH